MNYIIGGSTTGLVLLELLKGKGYKLLTNGIGGKLSSNDFSLGPRILHKTEATEKFLYNIGYFEPPTTFKIGFVRSGFLVDEVTEEQKLVYFQNTRGKQVEVNKTFLSEGKKEIVGWDLNDLNLVEKLYERNQQSIIDMNVTSIDTYFKTINDSLKYDNLISTISLKSLSVLLDTVQLFNEVVKEKPAIFTLVIKKHNDYFDNKDLSYVYFLNHKNIKRITKLNDSLRVVESKVNIRENDNYFPLKCIAVNCVLGKELKMKTYKGITLAGRFAQSDHSVKLNNVVERFQNGI